MKNIYLINTIRNRKALYFSLAIMIVFVMSLSVVYAALSVTLNITGTSQIIASN